MALETGDPQDPRDYLHGLSDHPNREGDTSNMNPEFASRLAAALRQANAEGLRLGVMSGFREGSVTGSKYDMGGNSSHTYGLASDISGLDGPNGKVTQRWAQIAAANGLSNPYGVGNKAEFNHWQLPAQPLEQTPELLASLKAAKATGDMNKVWSTYNGYAPTTYGTTVNASNAPVAGALAPQGPGHYEILPDEAHSPHWVSDDPRQIVYNKLTAAGLSPQQAVGALWGLGGEGGAGLDPRSYNAKDPGGSIGYGQWNQDRRTALESLAKTNGTSWADPNTQADHIVNELTNKDYATYQPGVFAALKAAKTPEEAARIWTSQYERPQKDNSDQRIAGGPNVASLDKNGNFVLGPGAGGTSGTAVASAAPATAAQPPQEQSWLDKLIKPPVDAEGKPVSGAKSPLQELAQASIARLGSEGQTERQESPQMSMGAGPGARNVSPFLGNPQAYGQTLNSFSQPLTWTSRPGGAPGMPVAGLQGPLAPQTPGVSLNSFQPSSQGLGYGVPDVGYGYG